MDTLDYEKAKDFVKSKYPNAIPILNVSGLFIVTLINDYVNKWCICVLREPLLNYPMLEVIGSSDNEPEAWIKAAEYIVENG